MRIFFTCLCTKKNCTYLSNRSVIDDADNVNNNIIIIIIIIIKVISSVWVFIIDCVPLC